MLKWFGDLFRGYSDRDIASVAHKIDGLLIKVGTPERGYLRLTRREWRAFIDQEMHVSDGLRRHPGEYLPSLIIVFCARKYVGQTVGDRFYRRSGFGGDAI